ncbi:MAG: hypothetical protein J5606_09180, partial [Bacteroidales bacterium]|nr:hypothetical protein [Bacteroidales bacterium]
MKNKKIILIFTLCLLYVSIGFTQSVPNWVDADVRATKYSSNKYLIGFAYGNLNGKENLAQATERIKNAAQSNLLESIQVNMKSNTRSAITAENVNGQYYENEAFV